MSGFVFKFAAGAVCWRSKKQDFTAQSTLEAEFVSMSFSIREAIWLRRIMFDVDTKNNCHEPTVIFGDNEGALELAYNDKVNERSRHIEFKYFFSREKVKDGTVVFSYIPSDENIADIMTKIITPAVHKRLVVKMGIRLHATSK